MTLAAERTVAQNKFEKFKAEKDGLAVKSEIHEFARIGWEAINETDRDHRLNTRYSNSRIWRSSEIRNLKTSLDRV